MSPRAPRPLSAAAHAALVALLDHPDGCHFYPALHRQGVWRSTLRALERRGLVTCRQDILTTLTPQGRALATGEPAPDEGDL